MTQVENLPVVKDAPPAPPPNRPIPNAALRTLFKAIEEVMGTNGLKAVLNLGGLQRYINNLPLNNLENDVRHADYGAAQQAVENFYGGRGARAMLAQIGRATFRYSLEEQPAVLGLAGLAMRMLPATTRMKLVLSRIVDAGNKKLNMGVSLSDDEEKFTIRYEACPGLHRVREDNTLCCYTTVGVFQEATRWLSGGKHYRVQQIDCRRSGGACQFCIWKKPVE
jgi:hypothetical protein